MEQARSEAAAAVLETVAAINTSWRAGRWDELGHHLHPEMVVLAPDGSQRLESREASIASYREFLEAAEILDYRESDHTVDLVGPTAVAVYRFDITYAMDGAELRDRGRDLFVFQRGGDGAWRAIWRTLMVEG